MNRWEMTSVAWAAVIYDWYGDIRCCYDAVIRWIEES